MKTRHIVHKTYLLASLLLTGSVGQALADNCPTGNATAKSIIYKVDGKKVSSLQGNVKQGSTVEVTFSTDKNTTKTKFSLVSYEAPAATYSESTADQQKVYQQQTIEAAPGSTNTLKVKVPSCYYQVDFVKGCVLTQLGPSGSNNFYGKQGRLIDHDNGGGKTCVADNGGGGNNGHPKKVTICHVPPGNPSNAHTITISENAVDAHFRNHSGDHYGACELDTTPPPACSCDADGDGQSDEQVGSTNYNISGTITTWFSPNSDTVKVTTTKHEISNVVLNLSNGKEYKYDNQKGYTKTYVIPRQYAGTTIEGVWVKAGNNASGDGPGYGEYIDNLHGTTMDYTCDCDTFALPVKLTRFEAVKKGEDKVELQWSTASEENNEYFSIEKTYDNQSWQEVCRVPGHGTTQEPHDYSCDDNAPAEGGNKLVYYRPKQVDYNGAYEYFNIIKIRLAVNSGNATVNNVYPNPAVDRLYINYNATENGTFNIRLLSLDGKEMLKQQYIAKPGDQVMDVDITENTLRSGYYILEVENGGQVYHSKIYKQ